ncbi:MAG: type IV-A pilus assembly ATPase PilB [Gammaproteobacteria bacterium]|nr:MAG: type IV-A pilus assembly ATPase PilB [Gammaproteobacteria bacterium]
MAAAGTVPALSGLAKRLVQDGIIDEEVAQSSLDEAIKQKTPFVTLLVQKKLADSNRIAMAAADEFGVPLFDLSAMDSEAQPQELIKDTLIRQHHILPLFHRGNRLYIAVSDPTNLQALDEIKFHTGINTESILAEEDKLAAAIEQYLDKQDDSLDDLGDTDLDDLDIESGDQKEEEQDTKGADEAPIVRFVNKILLDAIKMGASDIHFEPYEKSYRIRFRADGILQEVARPPINLSARLAARLKVMSRMDISERRIPQDGRIKLKISKTRAIDFRVNTLPTLFGEKVVLRILDPDSAKLGIDKLGYEEEQKKLFLHALSQPQGMILVTGPTGSGKTVSLYTGLNILNTPETNISTAEDPVEINLEGINQVHVNHKVGLDFSTALRSFLRQDPDVVMVGEIRDKETGEIAIKAAQTGHLVLSTLHTNSAPETLTRLRNMGIPSFNIATSVTLIIAQRLARRLCPHCKKALDIPKEALLETGYSEEQIPDLTLFGPIGCAKCNDGYKGRVGIYEVMKITESIGRIIMEEGNSIQIGDQALAEGFPNLRISGLKKAADGVTSLEEINRVTSGH